MQAGTVLHGSYTGGTTPEDPALAREMQFVGIPLICTVNSKHFCHAPRLKTAMQIVNEAQGAYLFLPLRGHT